MATKQFVFAYTHFNLRTQQPSNRWRIVLADTAKQAEEIYEQRWGNDWDHYDELDEVHIELHQEPA